MDAQTVRTALGTLQLNPDAGEAWDNLEQGLGDPGAGDLELTEALDLLRAARQRHAARGESRAVCRLLESSIPLTEGGDQVELLLELSRVQLEELFEAKAALSTLQRAVDASGGDEQVQRQHHDLAERSDSWDKQAAQYLAEAEAATDDAYRSAMLMRAAEVEVSFADEPNYAKVTENLEMSLRLDSSNLPATRLLEAIYRKRQDAEGLERVLGRAADRAPDHAARVAAGIRLARHYQHQRQDEEKAAKAFDRVLDSDPTQPDAVGFLTDYYSRQERWDELVRVYERPLKAPGDDSERVGDMLQVAMLHWKKRESPADAEPWFDRIRVLEPAHEGVLAFYREYKSALNDDAGLVQILQAAQRAVPADSPEAKALSQEVASHAESQANAHKSIEKLKGVLRESPDDDEAREQLKKLYKQTQGHNALVELLRQQLDRTAEEDYTARLAIMREIAGVYREYVKSDTALVGVLNQVVQLDGKLDEHDVDEVRELVELYDKLGRPRDLLASQKLLAEIVPDVEEKKSLYRQVGRRWLEQYSNVQHAMEAFAALHDIDPQDEEAMERLEDLYRKRRAWKELFALYKEQLESREGDSRVPLLREMGQLAAERLGQTQEALSYYREALDLAPERTELLDRMEKYAERAKAWEALADVLERRLKAMPEDESRLPVLQKLGSVYADHLDAADEAIGTWRRVVDVQPGHPRAMRVLRDTYLKSGRLDELEDLYSSQGDLEGLAEVLSTAADRTSEPDKKLELSYRAARVFEEKLGQSARAVRSYERILSIDPKDSRAIERLLPLYEADEKWVRVPPLLEVQAELAEEPSERVRVLERLVEVTGEKLGDRKGAVTHARRAYQTAPEDPRTVELLDSASRAAGLWDEMVAALSEQLDSLQAGSGLSGGEPVGTQSAAEQAQSAPTAKKGRRRRRKGRVSEPAEQPTEPQKAADSAQATSQPEEDPERVTKRRAVALRLARVQGEELGQLDEAVARLKQLAEETPNQPDVLDAFEALLKRESRPDDVRWLFEHRQSHAEAAEQRSALLCAWAHYEETDREDASRALALYRQAVETHPENQRALEAVARLALAAAEPAVAVEAVEKHRDLLAGMDRAELDAVLAELYADHVQRHADALAAAQRALNGGVEPGRVIPVLQSLVDVPEVRGDAARILSEQYEAGGDARKEADALKALISETPDAGEKIELVQRLASLYQDKLSEPSGALSVVFDALKEHPGDLMLWDRASELAGQAGRSVDLASAYAAALKTQPDDDVALDLARRAAALCEDVLADAVAAIPFYEKILALEPDDTAAFERLKEILTAAERWQELEQLYDREIRRRDDEVRRVEMLAEVALLAEDIMAEPRRAVDYHRRIREIDPDYPVSLASLDRLYTRLGDKAELLAILDKRAELSAGEEQHGYLVRIGQVCVDLEQPERAMTAIERVLEDDPGNYEARDVAETLLEVPVTRSRAARSLEVVYETRDEIRDLVRVLGVRVETLRPDEGDTPESPDFQEQEDERRDVLRRIATLRDDRLHDDEGSFDVFAELAPLDPLDVDLRERLIDSGRRLGRNQRVVEVLSSAAARAETPALRAEILLQTAEIQQAHLDDQGAAESSLRQVVELRSEEPELGLNAAKQLEALFVAGDRGEELIENLKIQIELETDIDRRPDLLARLAQLSTQVLGDDQAAIDAWRRRLADNPDDREALINLSELYERTEQYAELADVLQQRRDAAVEETERLNAARQLAEVQEKHLDATDQAIDSYRSLLDEAGPEAGVLEALVRLFTKAERWDELADIHERQVEVLHEEGEQLAALTALGRIRGDKLADLAGALDAHRRALTLNAGHSDSRDELWKLAKVEDPLMRLEAAETLQPIYELEGNHERLLEVMEVQAGASDDPAYRAERLGAAMRVAEDALENPARAFEFCVRGVKAAAATGNIAEWLPALDRLAAQAGTRQRQVEVLETVAAEIFDTEQQLEALSRVAALRVEVLGDREGAIAAHRKCLEIQPDYGPALKALEVLYAETEQWSSLLEVLETREQGTTSDDDRKELAYRKAQLLADELEDKSRAIETYEGILDLGMESRAIEALERLYDETERYDDWVALVQRRIDAQGGSAPVLRVELARVVADKQKELDRAIDELEQALNEDAQNEAAIDLLERLVSSTEDPMLKGRMAALLEPVYMVRADFDKVLDALGTRLAGAQDPDERRELVHRIAQIQEEQKEDYDAALEVVATLLADDPQDESTLEEMERLAQVAGAERRLAELLAEQVAETEVEDDASARLCRRAGELFEGLELGDKALPLLRRALAFEPDNQELFRRVDGLLQKNGTAEERIALHRKALEHRFAPEDQVQLLHVIAELEEKQLGHPDEAIEAHRQVIEVDERDQTSLDALTLLYASRERWEDLAELYQRRAEGSLPEEGARYRLALASLCLKRLERKDAALDQLEEVVRDLPEHQEAIERLEALREHEELKRRVVDILRPIYEAQDDWKRLIRLNEDRFALAEDPHEQVAILKETAELWEARGEDTTRARRALFEAYRIDPEDETTRADLERLSAIEEKWESLAQLYDEILDAHPELGPRVEVVGRLAQLYDSHVDDPRSALARYSELHDLAAGDPEPVEAMVRLATLLGDWEKLEKGLAAYADIVFDEDERVTTLARLGELRYMTLEDIDGAISAYERAFEADADNGYICDQLIELYEGKEDPPRLVDLYLARVEMPATDDDQRYELLLKAAELLEKNISDNARAIDCLGQALGVRPGDQQIIAELNRLYRREEMWPDLLDNLRLEAGTAETPDSRLAIRHEIAKILAAKLASYEEALEAYGIILDERPDDEKALDAVFELAEREEHLRQQAADLLVPALRQTGLRQRLVRALELRLSVEQEPSVRVETLRTVAQVQENDLAEPKKAFESLLRAIVETPDALELYDELERLAPQVQGWSRYAEALDARAAEVFEPELARDLWVRLARIREEKLDEKERAIDAYQKATEQAGDRLELLDALDRLYTALDDTAAVVDLLDRRMALADTDEAQARLYCRQGQLQLDKQGEPTEALASFRQALERDVHNTEASEQLLRVLEHEELFEEVFEVLDGVFRERSAGPDLAALHQRRVARAEDEEEKLDMRRGLAQVLEEECSDPLAAQRVLQEAFSSRPTDPGLPDELERLATITDAWSEAAEALLAPLQKDAALDAGPAREACERAAAWFRRAQDPAGAERALKLGLGFAPDSEEVLEQLEALQSEPGRERDLLETVRQRAALAAGETKLELLKKGKQLADATEQAAVSEELLRSYLELEPEDGWALEELTHLRRAAGDYEETYELMTKRAELEADGDRRWALRFGAAEIARDELGRVDQATTVFEELFEERPDDVAVSDALRASYQAAERYSDLAALTERLIERTDDPAQAANLRVAMAELHLEQLAETDRAVEILEGVFQDDPHHPQAALVLAKVYENEQRFSDLAGLLGRQAEAAFAGGNDEAGLDFQRRLAQLAEQTLQDDGRALATWQKVAERDSSIEVQESVLRLQLATEDKAAAAVTLSEIASRLEGEAAVSRKLELADLYKELGDREQLISTLEQARELDPENGPLAERLRAEYEAAGAWDKVAQVVLAEAEASEETKTRVDLYREAANIYWKKQAEPGRASELLAKAAELVPDDRDLLLELCDAYSASGRGAEAVGTLEQIVESYGGKRSKELGEIHRRLATAYLSQGDQERAKEELEKAFRIEPGNVNILKQLGELSLETGDTKKAQQMFRALLLQRLDASSPITKAEVFCKLASLHQQLGETPKAKQYYERALQEDSDLQAAKDGLDSL